METQLNFLAQATQAATEQSGGFGLPNLMSIVGYVVILVLCFLLSANRSAINYRTVGLGLLIQFILGILLIKVDFTADLFKIFTDGVASFLALSNEGASMIFGSLADPGGSAGWVFAFQVLPTIIFFSAFISILYYLGIVQFVISLIAKAMQFLLKTSGSETLSCSANIFVGQTEAPLMIKPFLGGMTNSEINAVMVGGFATIAGGVLAAYIGLGISAQHLVTASVMAAPCALAIAKLLFPETEHSETSGDAEMPKIDAGDNVLDAAAKGTTDGLNLALNVAAMLIAFLSIIAVVDWVLGGVDYFIDYKLVQGGVEDAVMTASGEYKGYFPGSLNTILGTLLYPFVILLGVPLEDASKAGQMLGIKVVANEFVAYLQLSGYQESGEITPRTAAIMSFACCGFANLSSIGIQLGGIGALAPERRKDLSRLAVRALFGGVMVSCLSACIAGFLFTTTPAAPQGELAPGAAAEQVIEEGEAMVEQVEENLEDSMTGDSVGIIEETPQADEPPQAEE